MLRKACGAEAKNAETAIRFILLVVKRGRFAYMDRILREIERILDAGNGILTVTLETVAAAADTFKESLRAQLQEKTGAREIRIETRIVPELLGGYRLRMGTELIDASLSLFLKEMAADMAATNELASTGGV
jgi:F-type H+-transporting ATPase subunit delta